MAAIDQSASFSPDVARWRRPNFLLILCVAIGIWLVLVPVAALLLTAFTEDTGLGFGAWTLDNFVEAYASERILRLIANSLIYAAGTAALLGGCDMAGGGAAATVEAQSAAQQAAAARSTEDRMRQQIGAAYQQANEQRQDQESNGR